MTSRPSTVAAHLRWGRWGHGGMPESCAGHIRAGSVSAARVRSASGFSAPIVEGAPQAGAIIVIAATATRHQHIATSDASSLDANVESDVLRRANDRLLRVVIEDVDGRHAESIEGQEKGHAVRGSALTALVANALCVFPCTK